ncbi:DUF1127 domain-containing protein [Pseudomonas sp.]|jgi:uncharacterized protein YjiS (DUF1127 family)|uniref:DUF1127 domain-containing protein n=1 Tax=Pseudomonas sp. TaxID=306 RepID=UPI0028AD861C|nr:DUF1127 domain-containing protein [Pseudomonas sp.]
MKKQQKGYALIMHPQLPASLWSRLVRRLGHWHELSVQRRRLAGLGEAELKDIGFSRADVEQEIQRPFWRD